MQVDVQLKMRKTPAFPRPHAWRASLLSVGALVERCDDKHCSHNQTPISYRQVRNASTERPDRTACLLPLQINHTMSYTFSILSPLDVPLFTHDFGTSRSGGDGVARFTPSERALVPFILHSALDIVEEVQWGPSTSSGSAPMYLKHIDKYQNCYISCWITGANTRFLLLTRPRDESLGLTGSGGGARGSLAGGRAALGGGQGLYNPTSPATEEAVKNFFVDVYEAWMKTIMSPFFQVGNGDVVKSPVFRQRVAAAAKKYL